MPTPETTTEDERVTIITSTEIDSGTVTTTPTVVDIITTTDIETTTPTTNPTTTVDSDMTENLDVDSLIGRFNIDIRR